MRSKEYYMVRLHKLEQKDPVANKNIIHKLARKLRRLYNVEVE